MSQHPQNLRSRFPHTSLPLIIAAPTRPFTSPSLAVAVIQAGGLPFLPASANPADNDSHLQQLADLLGQVPSQPNIQFRAGIGYQIYQDNLDGAVETVRKSKIAAVWLFAWRDLDQLKEWAEKLSDFPEAEKPELWAQVGSVTEAMDAAKLLAGATGPERTVIVCQSGDAGGHGRINAAGLTSLVPETRDALDAAGLTTVPVIATGGIAEARGAAAALALGAAGVAMGTRFLATTESIVPEGFKQAVLNSNDGGVHTVKDRLFDRLRGTGDFPDGYDGRAIRNVSTGERDEGIEEDEIQKKYREIQGNKERHAKEGHGVGGRLVNYAGTGLGLVKELKGAGEVVKEVREGAKEALSRAAGGF